MNEPAIVALEPRHTSRLLSFFAKDELTSTLQLSIYEHETNSFQEATYVQSVGMPQPVPVLDLYQMTRLKSGPQPDVASLIASERNVIIYAGPGQGKTTFLKHQLLTRVDDQKYIPLLFTLRTSGNIDWLREIIQMLDLRRRFQRVPHTPDKLLLLVDGYDEVNDDQRQAVSRMMARFSGLNAGNFVMTCRTGYTVTGVAAAEYELAEFDRIDAIAFVDAFAHAMQIGLSGRSLISELEERKLIYIVSHPLMLTLACVIKTRTNPDLPHNAIELMRQVIETLAFRWDEGKGVARASRLGLYSIQMLDCITRLAFEMESLKVQTGAVTQMIGRYLTLIRRPEIMPERVLDEIRAFYGVLFTTPDGYCQFVHKTVQDYLAARYIVEKGLFQPAKSKIWDLRFAYCACLTHDATQALCWALRHSRTIEAVRECLVNNAFFDPQPVASAVFEHFDNFRDNFTIVRIGSPPVYSVSCKSDFFGLADDVFLSTIVSRAYMARPTTGTSAVLGMCASEYIRRGLSFSSLDMEVLKRNFESVQATLTVWRSGREHRFTLSEIANKE